MSPASERGKPGQLVTAGWEGTEVFDGEDTYLNFQISQINNKNMRVMKIG